MSSGVEFERVCAVCSADGFVSVIPSAMASTNAGSSGLSSPPFTQMMFSKFRVSAADEFSVLVEVGHTVLLHLLVPPFVGISISEVGRQQKHQKPLGLGALKNPIGVREVSLVGVEKSPGTTNGGSPFWLAGA